MNALQAFIREDTLPKKLIFGNESQIALVRQIEKLQKGEGVVHLLIEHDSANRVLHTTYRCLACTRTIALFFAYTRLSKPLNDTAFWGKKIITKNRDKATCPHCGLRHILNASKLWVKKPKKAEAIKFENVNQLSITHE